MFRLCWIPCLKCKLSNAENGTAYYANNTPISYFNTVQQEPLRVSVIHEANTLMSLYFAVQR